MGEFNEFDCTYGEEALEEEPKEVVVSNDGIIELVEFEEHMFCCCL